MRKEFTEIAKAAEAQKAYRDALIAVETPEGAEIWEYSRNYASLNVDEFRMSDGMAGDSLLLDYLSSGEVFDDREADGAAASEEGE